MDFDIIFKELKRNKNIIDGVQCWSLRRLCNIFDVYFTTTLTDLKTILRDLNKQGKDLQEVSEFVKLKDNGALSFLRVKMTSVQLEDFETVIDDYYVNSYLLSYSAFLFTQDIKMVDRLRWFILLETCECFPDKSLKLD